MSLVMVVTQNLPGRFEGFLVGNMLKVAPGVYLSPKMSKRVRDRMWEIFLDWSAVIPPENGGLVMLWPSKEAPSGVELRFLGWPPKTLVSYDGLWLVKEGICVHHRFYPEDHLPLNSLLMEQAWRDPLPDLTEDTQITLDSWLDEQKLL